MFDRPTNTSAYCSDEKSSTTPILSYQTIKSHRIVTPRKPSKKSGTPLSDLSVVGLGLTGTLLSTGFANQGHHVIAVDTDLHKVKCINQGNSPILHILALRDHHFWKVRNTDSGFIRITFSGLIGITFGIFPEL
jgi:hypothetical protein